MLILATRSRAQRGKDMPVGVGPVAAVGLEIDGKAVGGARVAVEREDAPGKGDGGEQGAVFEAFGRGERNDSCGAAAAAQRATSGGVSP